MKRRLAGVIALLLIVPLSGCRPRPVAEPPPKNLLEWFQQKERYTSTPEGEIDVATVRTPDEQTVIYETVKAGTRKTWKVQFRAKGKGSYERLGDPVEVKPTG
jgi:hypothetical protein